MTTRPGLPLKPQRFDLTIEQYHLIETWQADAPALLKKFRTSRGWTKVELARQCCCSDTLVTYWEDGTKKPSGARKQSLLALMAPRNAAQVKTEGFLTSSDLDGLLLKLQQDGETPIERRHALLDSNYEKVTICLILKCTGTILPGVDVKAIQLFYEQHEKVAREYKLSQSKSANQVSQAGRRWLKGDVLKAKSTEADPTTTSSNDGGLHNTSTATPPPDTTIPGSTENSS